MTTTEERADEYRIGIGRLFTLLAGRATFRVLLYGSTFVLLAAWSRDDFNRYSAVLGAVNWVGLIVQAGTEKAALKLIPRARRTRDDLVGLLHRVVKYTPMPFTGAAVIMLAAAPRSMATLYTIGVAYFITLGSSMLGVAVHRVMGRPSRDTAYFSLLGVGIAAMAALTFVAPIAPVGYLSGLLAMATVLNAALLPGLSKTRRPHGSLRRILGRTSVMMGAPDVLASASVGALFVVLSVTEHSAQSGDLYLVATGWALFYAVLYTVQRIYQPRLSARLAMEGPTKATSLGLRLSRLTAWISAGWLVAVGVALPVGLAGAATKWPVAILAGLVISRLPIILLMSYGIYVLENVDGKTLQTSAQGAVLSAAAVVLVGAVTIPFVGAVGAVYALAVKELVLGLTVGRSHS